MTAFDPARRSTTARAIRAGLIALERGSGLIDVEDWIKAARPTARIPSESEYAQLKNISVSDDLVMTIAGKAKI